MFFLFLGAGCSTSSPSPRRGSVATKNLPVGVFDESRRGTILIQGNGRGTTGVRGSEEVVEPTTKGMVGTTNPTTMATTSTRDGSVAPVVGGTTPNVSNEVGKGFTSFPTFCRISSATDTISSSETQSSDAPAIESSPSEAPRQLAPLRSHTMVYSVAGSPTSQPLREPFLGPHVNLNSSSSQPSSRYAVALASVGPRKSSSSSPKPSSSLNSISGSSPALSASEVQPSGFSPSFSPLQRTNGGRTSQSRMIKRNTLLNSSSNLHLYPDLETFGLGESATTMTTTSSNGGIVNNVPPSTPLSSSSLAQNIAQPASHHVGPQTPRFGAQIVGNGATPSPSGPSAINTTTTNGSPVHPLRTIATGPNSSPSPISSKRYSYGGASLSCASSLPLALQLAASHRDRGSFSSQLSPTASGSGGPGSGTNSSTSASGISVPRSFAASRFRLGGSPTLAPIGGGRLSGSTNSNNNNQTNNSSTNSNPPSVGFSPQRSHTLHLGSASPKVSGTFDGTDASGVVPLELGPSTGTTVTRSRSISNAQKRYSLQGSASLLSLSGSGRDSGVFGMPSSSPTNIPNNGTAPGISILHRDSERSARIAALSISPTKTFYSPTHSHLPQPQPLSSSQYATTTTRQSPIHPDSPQNSSNVNGSPTLPPPILPLAQANVTFLPSLSPIGSRRMSGNYSGAFSHFSRSSMSENSILQLTSSASSSAHHSLTPSTSSSTSSAFPMLRRTVSEPEEPTGEERLRETILQQQQQQPQPLQDVTV